MQQQVWYYPVSPQAPVAMETAQGPHPVLLRNGSGIRRLKVRHPMFKVAVGILLLSMGFFLAGFCGVAWHGTEGLWRVCYPSGECVSNCIIFRYDTTWLNAVRSLESLSLIALAASFCFLIYQDVVPSLPPPESKAVEIGAAIAGHLNLIGLIVYSQKKQGEMRETNYKYDYFDPSNYYYYDEVDFRPNWAYWMALTSCVLTLLAASAIAYSRVKHADRTLQEIRAAGGINVLPTRAVSARPSMVGVISQPFPHASQPLPSTSQIDHGMYPPLPTGNQQPSAPLPPPYPHDAQPMMPAASSAMDQTPAPLPMSPSNVPGPSAVPLYYLVNQGHTIPVYDQAPQASTAVISSSA